MNTQTGKREIVIPFSGFFQSLHDGEIDNAVDHFFQDESGESRPALSARLYDSCDFRAVFNGYAREYAEQFAREFSLPSLEFCELVSPREYNFTTDRIFCTIGQGDIDRLLSEAQKDLLAETAAEWFTSRSGFISFYSPDVAEWGDASKWDHNQLGCLLTAFVRTKAGETFDQWREMELMEGPLCNGFLDNAIAENTTDITRLYAVADYLNKRAARA